MKRFLGLLLTAMMLLAACDNGKKVDGMQPSTTDTTDAATAPVTIPDTFPVLYNNVTIICAEGTPGCYSIEGNTILFTEVSEDSLYTISGEWTGNIVIDVGETHKFELEMQGLSLAAEEQNPISIYSGNKVTLTAKKDYENSIFDKREAVDSEADGIHAAAIYAQCDLTIGGKGSLLILSSHNNGIHTKDDLEVKNLNLTVVCKDNALKGNDSVTVNHGTITLIASQGDGIKTTNSNVSEKGNQRGNILITGSTLSIFAACDGIDAAHDAIIEDAATDVKIYTHKYSEYSEALDYSGVDSDEALCYIRFPGDSYHYAVQYYNSDDDNVWVTASHHSTVSGGRQNYYYYAFPVMDQYAKIRYFGYTATQTAGQDEDYAFCTDFLSVNRDYDTFAIYIRGNSLSYSWENYTTQIQDGFGGGPGGHGPGGMGGGPGGMQEGNADKGDYSTKGIKAANSIVISAGTVHIKSYDDAIHANGDSTLENGETPTGNVTISGGDLTIFSNDDGIHADGIADIMDGTVNITNAYEGIEGAFVHISGGHCSVISSDDGVNATATSGEAIVVSGGYLYVYAGGDGLDSNSTSAYDGIWFSGGTTVVISASNGNSAIDSERGYRFTGGNVLAVTSSGGMSRETTNVSNLTTVGKKQNMSLIKDHFLQIRAGNDTVVTVKMPCGLSATVVFLGDPDVTFSGNAASDDELDPNGVCWNITDFT